MNGTAARSGRTHGLGRILTVFALVFTMIFGTVNVSAATPLAKALGTKASVKSGYYILTPKCASSRALSIAGDSKKNGANAYICKNSKKNSQIFYVKSLGNGLYSLQNKNSGKYLEVSGGSSKNKANVDQNKKIASRRWNFYLIKTGSGYVIQSSYTKYVMTVNGSKNADKTNVLMYTYKKMKGQFWTLTPYTATKSTSSANSSSSSSEEVVTLDGSKTSSTAASAAKTASSTAAAATASKSTTSNVVTRKYASSTVNGKRTIKTYLQNALVPVGRTLYIWGGGWGGIGSGSKNDTAVIGYQTQWNTFFKKHANSSYNYKNYRYSYGNGLDCSGFVAWTTYNTLYTTKGKADLVTQSTGVAKNYANRGWAKLSTNYKKDQTFHPGDVVSMNGHVWISLGECSDGSVLLVHSSPRGVQISGTSGQAYSLAKYYMTKYFPEWPYTARCVSKSYLQYAGKATWKVSGKGSVMKDPEGIQKMTANECMKAILGS